MRPIRMCSSSHVRRNLPRKHWEERPEDSVRHSVVVLPGTVLWGRDAGDNKGFSRWKSMHSAHTPMVAPTPRWHLLRTVSPHQAQEWPLSVLGKEQAEVPENSRCLPNLGQTLSRDAELLQSHLHWLTPSFPRSPGCWTSKVKRESI